MPRRWRQKRWRHENHHGIPPNNRRQAVQRLGSTSVRPPQPKNRRNPAAPTLDLRAEIRRSQYKTVPPLPAPSASNIRDAPPNIWERLGARHASSARGPSLLPWWAGVGRKAKHPSRDGGRTCYTARQVGGRFLGHAMTAERIEYDDLDAAAQAKIAQAVKMTPRKSRVQNSRNSINAPKPWPKRSASGSSARSNTVNGWANKTGLQRPKERC